MSPAKATDPILDGNWADVLGFVSQITGHGKVSTLTDGSSPGQQIAAVFPLALRGLLSRADWVCARKKITLTPLAKDDGADEDEVAYELPEDYVRQSGPIINGMEVRHGKIYVAGKAPEEKLSFVYVGLIYDENHLDPPDLRTALAYSIAAAIYGGPKSEPNNAARARNNAERHLNQAKYLNNAKEGKGIKRPMTMV